MKKHPFFASINWSQLIRRELAPPIVLTMDDSDFGGESEEGQFLKQLSAQKEIFKDKDYETTNKTLNRVK